MPPRRHSLCRTEHAGESVCSPEQFSGAQVHTMRGSWIHGNPVEAAASSLAQEQPRAGAASRRSSLAQKQPRAEAPVPSTPSHDTATGTPPHAGCLSSCSCWSLQRTSPSLPRESAGNPSGMCTAAAARQRPGRLRPRTRALPRPACQGRHAAPRCAGSARRLTALPKPPPQILPVVAVPIRVPPRVPPHALRRPAPTTPAPASLRCARAAVGWPTEGGTSAIPPRKSRRCTLCSL